MHTLGHNIGIAQSRYIIGKISHKLDTAQGTGKIWHRPGVADEAKDSCSMRKEANV